LRGAERRASTPGRAVYHLTDALGVESSVDAERVYL
jgi:hypothetical protein